MTGRPSRAASSAKASPTRRFRSSDSTTQGPAMRNGAVANTREATAMRLVFEARELGGRLGRHAHGLLVVLQGGRHESGEQRMRTHRPGLELGMELAADVPGVIGQLDHLDE